MRPTANTAARQADSTASVFSRKSRNSIASTRKPSVMWIASATTMPNSADCDHRLARHRQERVERTGAVERGGQREKMQRQKDRQRDAGQAVEQGRDEAALFVRGAHHACPKHREHGAQTEHEQQQLQTTPARRRANGRATRVHSRKILRSPIGAWIATAITNSAIEQQEDKIAVGARQNIGRGQPAAHRIEDGAEMHGDRERQHERGRPLRQEQDRASRARPASCGAAPRVSGRRSHRSARSPSGRTTCSSYACGRPGSRRCRKRRRAALAALGRARH